MQVIAAQGLRPYSRSMASAILRFAMLVALALMPFGMGGAAAIAANATPAAVAEDCGDHHQPAQDSPMKAQLHCGACAALAAIENPKADAELRPELPRILRTINSPWDTEPDTATPPPRIS